jgi:hypothetical protein
MLDSHRIAERLLTILTSREHAATIVGDLAETAAARDGKGFWSAVAVTAAALALRPTAIIVAGFAIQSVIRYTMRLSFVSHQFRAYGDWAPALAGAMGISAMQISVIAVFSAAFHGFRDPIARLALALTLIFWIGGTLHFLPVVLYPALAASTAVIVFAVFSAHFRAALAALIVALVVSRTSSSAVLTFASRDDGTPLSVPVIMMSLALLLVLPPVVASIMRRRLPIY